MMDLLSVKNLKKHFQLKKGPVWKRKTTLVKAVDDVSFNLKKNKTLGIVGESGCGKTTTGMMIMNLLRPTAGEIMINGKNLSQLNETNLISERKNIQMIFQDPFASLDPMMTLNSIVSEPFDIYNLYSQGERLERVGHLLEIVGLDKNYGVRYPHEFSGGQRQRVAIARALALEPQLLVADEPTSALDVSVKAQIINLLMDLRKKRELTMIFISHDLSVVRHISDEIIVMYLGKIMESGPIDKIFDNPLHPYTRVLLNSIPNPNPRKRRQRNIISGDIFSVQPPENGCRFYPRCKEADDNCLKMPVLTEIEPEHYCACLKQCGGANI